MHYEIGIDIGGTFTDVVCRGDNGSLRIAKLPTTRGDPSRAVLAALDMARDEWGVPADEIGRFVHGTTAATNAVIERKGARIGLITTEGFRDVLEIGRQMRHQMYDLVLQPETPVFLAPRRRRKEVRERLDAQGNVLTPLDEDSVQRALAELVAADVQAVAISLLFSFLDPTHERRIRDIATDQYPALRVSLSSDVDPAFREYERTCATAFDAYIKPVVADYLANMERGLAAAGIGVPLQVMQSRGGLASSAIARRRPIRLFLSGPAAGVVGGVEAGRAAGFGDLITVDIGGTSCDIALVTNGTPLIRSEGVIDGYAVRVPMVDVTAIGAGGGSIAWLDGAGSLRVGPHSAGSEPGPACYGRGGEQPTVTDASVVLGYIDPLQFAGGTLTLQPLLAHAAIEHVIAKPLNMTVEDAALGIHRVLNAQMAEAIRLVSVGRGIDPRGYALLPLGGGGPMHGCALAEELGIRTIVVPVHPGVLSAAGLLGAPVEHEIATAFSRELADLRGDELMPALRDLDASCAELMRQEGVSEPQIRHFADVCYIGQSYHLEVPLTSQDPASIYELFLTAHERIYGHSTRVPAKIVNLRTVHRSAPGTVAMATVRNKMSGSPTSRPVRVRDHASPVPAVIWHRDALAAGTVVPGPAIIEQADTTTLVESGWNARLAETGALLLEKAQ
ncbi:MAG TPA: hydantoinase/oxoprolinase family protein [Acetobacteraceae bacterium]|jgi:N-methylhydantoinase A/oxoprolinase/acetone carboxylase beta subunit